jgi:hypothetical protein
MSKLGRGDVPPIPLQSSRPAAPVPAPAPETLPAAPPHGPPFFDRPYDHPSGERLGKDNLGIDTHGEVARMKTQERQASEQRYADSLKKVLGGETAVLQEGIKKNQQKIEQIATQLNHILEQIKKDEGAKVASTSRPTFAQSTPHWDASGAHAAVAQRHPSALKPEQHTAQTWEPELLKRTETARVVTPVPPPRAHADAPSLLAQAKEKAADVGHRVERRVEEGYDSTKHKAEALGQKAEQRAESGVERAKEAGKAAREDVESTGSSLLERVKDAAAVVSTHAKIAAADVVQTGREIGDTLGGGKPLRDAAVVRDTPDLFSQPPQEDLLEVPTRLAADPVARERPTVGERLLTAKDIAVSHKQGAQADVAQAGAELKDVLTGRASLPKTTEAGTTVVTGGSSGRIAHERDEAGRVQPPSRYQ